MSPTAAAALRIASALAGAALLLAGSVLGYIAVIALRRSEGVFLPAGYVAVACLAAGGWLVNWSLRG